MTIPSAAQQACPARQVCGLTRDCFVQFVRRLTTKELVFLRFVAPRNARVNGKKWNRARGKMSPFPVSNGIVGGCVACSLPFWAPGSVRRSWCSCLVENFPHHAAEYGGAVRFLQ